MVNDQPSILPGQAAPVDNKQRILTLLYIEKNQTDIFKLLLEIRSKLDSELESKFPGSKEKFYPLGRCLEITEAVHAALMLRIQNPKRRAERALADFVAAGGIVRPIWGALRERFFQNATQFGALYIDVANDTVSVVKPKVEILPLEQCGLVPLHDIEHFQKIARRYWKAELYVNTIVPSLAPILPMISVTEYGHAQLVPAADYMMELAIRDRFQDAQTWIATGPAPPPNVVQAFQTVVPPHLCAPMDMDARQAAVRACIEARDRQDRLDPDWRRDIIEKYNQFNSYMSAKGRAA